MSLVIGVDIGGTHITAAAVDVVAGTVVEHSRYRRFVSSQDEAPVILGHWCDVIRSAARAIGPEYKFRVGLAMPGPFDYEEGICLIQEQKKFRSLYGLNVKEALASGLDISTADICFDNDAACFLKGEVLFGCARKEENVLGFTLGTGLGSAIYVDNHCRDAALWNAPFRGGIAEDFFSSRWFIGWYYKRTGKTVAGVQELLGEADEATTKELFAQFSENLACFLEPMMRQQGIEKLVFGGSISRADSWFVPQLKVHLEAVGLTSDISRSLLGEDAALFGAAGCWNRVDYSLPDPMASFSL